MDEAKAIINLKEGLIQLEGPVEFVREYLNRFATKGLQGKGIKVTPLKEGIKVKEKAGRRKRRRRKGGISCVEAIRAEAEGGFFNEARSTGETKRQLEEKGLSFSKNSIRIGFNKLIQAGLLSRTGVARSARYQRTG